jgi:hypothetical protein
VDALALHLLDAAQRVDEVHVPRAAPKFAVGHSPQPRLPLECDDPEDRLVLGRTQGVGVDLAGTESRPGPGQLGGAQQAADVVSTVGGNRTNRQGSSS